MEVTEAVEIAVKYEGSINRQEEVIKQFENLEHRRVPEDFNHQDIKGFSNEVAEKLKKVRPSSIGQASRISGVTPCRHLPPPRRPRTPQKSQLKPLPFHKSSRFYQRLNLTVKRGLPFWCPLSDSEPSCVRN